ncbi:sensor histidine kinase [Catenulispora pinisilvae]|uniref:sensor histidine kinase n=1 Tax=Catenulispora pinisilvae TaxID=2705253 RepID=UPI001890E65D|nr:HAMP domain-containing sensor histidine kinase [Catenulispora pinisilvae]
MRRTTAATASAAAPAAAQRAVGLGMGSDFRSGGAGPYGFIGSPEAAGMPGTGSKSDDPLSRDAASGGSSQGRSPLAIWRRTPLRARLALAATIAVAAGIGGGVGFAYVAVRHSLTQQVDDGLQRQGVKAQTAALLGGHFPRYDPAKSQQFGDTQTNFQFIDSSGTPLQAKVLPPSPRWPHGTVTLAPAAAPMIPISAADAQVAAGTMESYMHSGQMNGQHVRILTLGIRNGQAIQIDAPLTTVDKQLSTLGWQLFGAAAAGIVLAAGLGWMVTRTALRPVAELTSTAERIAATHDLAHRIPIDGRPRESRDELGRLAATFNSMLDAVQEATDRQRQLVADASHELRTPLTSLRTNVEVLAHAHRLEPEDRQALVTGIMSGLDDLTTLVSDTVELARGEEQAAHFEELRLDLLVQRCVDRAAAHWPKAVFKADLEESVVVGVTDRLAKAVRNLLDNAAKFSPTGGLVEVRTTTTPDGHVTLTVRDHGPGIPEADLPHVFDRFYRAASARDLPGSGLGLAIVAQVAVGHSGGVTAAGAQGGGAEFQLTLPLSGSSETGPRAAAGPRSFY